MDKLVYTAATGLRAHMAAQTAIANNMAKDSTLGLRSDRAVVYRFDQVLSPRLRGTDSQPR